MYQNAQMQVKCTEGLTRPIKIQRGVLQGDTLSPSLFNIVMEVVLRFLRSSCPNYGLGYEDTPRHFLKAYVDDLTVLTRKDDEMQRAMNTLQEILKCLGLSINVDKSRTQCMAMRSGTDQTGYMTRKPKILVDSKPIPHICDHGSTFLGMTLAPGAQQSRELFRKLDRKIKECLRNIDESHHSLPERL